MSFKKQCSRFASIIVFLGLGCCAYSQTTLTNGLIVFQPLVTSPMVTNTPALTNIEESDAFTITLRYKPSEISSKASLVSLGRIINFSLLADSGVSGFHMAVTNANGYILYGRLHWNPDTNWHFVAVTFDLVTIESTLRKDADIYQYLWTNRAPKSVEVTNSNVYIGETFKGTLADVRVYDRVLSAAEIQQLYDDYENEKSGARVALATAVVPTFDNLFIGASYQLQVSTDLSNWNDCGAPFIATSTFMRFPDAFNVGDGNSLHFRLQQEP